MFSSVEGLGLDLQSTPVLAHQLENARVCAESEIPSVFQIEVEEIDDCLAYVKVTGSIS